MFTENCVRQRFIYAKMHTTINLDHIVKSSFIVKLQMFVQFLKIQEKIHRMYIYMIVTTVRNFCLNFHFHFFPSYIRKNVKLHPTSAVTIPLVKVFNCEYQLQAKHSSRPFRKNIPSCVKTSIALLQPSGHFRATMRNNCQAQGIVPVFDKTGYALIRRSSVHQYVTTT